MKSKLVKQKVNSFANPDGLDKNYAAPCITLCVRVPHIRIPGGLDFRTMRKGTRVQGYKSTRAQGCASGLLWGRGCARALAHPCAPIAYLRAQEETIERIDAKDPYVSNRLQGCWFPFRRGTDRVRSSAGPRLQRSLLSGYASKTSGQADGCGENASEMLCMCRAWNISCPTRLA